MESALGPAVLCLRVLEGHQVIAYSEGLNRGKPFRRIGYGSTVGQYELGIQWYWMQGNGEDPEERVERIYYAITNIHTGAPAWGHNKPPVSLVETGTWGPGLWSVPQAFTYVRQLPPMHKPPILKGWPTFESSEQKGGYRAVVASPDRRQIALWIAYGKLNSANSHVLRIGGGAHVDLARGPYAYTHSDICSGDYVCEATPRKLGDFRIDMSEENGRFLGYYVSGAIKERWVPKDVMVVPEHNIKKLPRPLPAR